MLLEDHTAIFLSPLKLLVGQSFHPKRNHAHVPIAAILDIHFKRQPDKSFHLMVIDFHGPIARVPVPIFGGIRVPVGTKRPPQLAKAFEVSDVLKLVNGETISHTME